MSAKTILHDTMSHFICCFGYMQSTVTSRSLTRQASIHKRTVHHRLSTTT